MQVFRGPDEVPADFGPSVVAIGKFDGVHAGHRAVIDAARADAAGGAPVVAVTFDRNPLSVIHPDRCPPEIVGVTQKIRLLAAAGADAALMLRFDAEMAAMTAEDFAATILRDALAARTVLLGADFRFGRGGLGTPALLTAEGFDVDVVDDVRAGAGRRVSSTWVREALAAGDVAEAARILGHAHGVRGLVVEGLQRGRELGYPTANLAPDAEGFVPADGVYAGRLVDESTGERHPAAISVGTNPTFDDVPDRRIEAYVLDRTDLDLYGHEVEVFFVDRLRGMAAFDGVEPLRAQMADDVARARALLS